jgi:hypothetical protein
MPRETETPKKTFTFGTCSFAKSSPNVETIGAHHRALNVFLSFEEALKLNVAVDEAIRRLNSYNRSTRAGKSAALNITLYLDKKRITINEGRL